MLLVLSILPVTCKAAFSQLHPLECFKGAVQVGHEALERPVSSQSKALQDCKAPVLPSWHQPKRQHDDH